MKKQDIDALSRNPLISQPEDADRSLCASSTMIQVSQVLSTIEELVGQQREGFNFTEGQTSGFWLIISCARKALDFEVVADSAFRHKQRNPRKPRPIKATPAKLRGIAARIKKASSQDELRPILDDIERLPEPHCKRLTRKWTERAVHFAVQAKGPQS
jgi:hypothetical protein